MDDQLKGKKVLVFGGIGQMTDLITLAHRNGVKVGVADYNRDTYIKSIADQAHDVDILDVPTIVDLYEREHYDGLITNFNDMLMPYACDVANKAGAYVPFDKEQIKMSTNKKYFKKKCMEYGVPVPREYDPKKDGSDIEFPVIVKPVDSSGSKGITICRSSEELEIGISTAASASRSHEYIVEQYIDYDDEINLTYIVQSGKVKLAAVHDRYFNESQEDVIRVPDLYIYPSKYTRIILDKYNDTIINMLEGIGLKHGSLFIQGCVKDKELYLYEAGMRLNGCKTYQILEYENKYNTFERLLRFSLTGDMGPICEFDPMFKKWYATWNVVCRSGKIGRITGDKEISSYPWLIHNAMAYRPGDVIGETARGTLLQLQSRIHVYGDTKEELFLHLRQLYELYHVLDENDEEMILPPHDMDDLRKCLNYDIC